MAFPLLIPLIAAAAKVGSSLLENSAQKKANNTNVRLQQEQQSWEEKMSSTAYVRATEDMKKAGLNPMLAYSQGGASTPNVSAATVNPVTPAMKGVTDAVQSALAVKQQQENVQLTAAQRDKTLADTENVQIDNHIRSWEIPYSAANAGNKAGQISSDLDKTLKEIEKLKQDISQGKGDYETRQKLQSKLIDGQELANQLSRLEIPGATNSANFERNMGQTGNAVGLAGKAMQLLNQGRQILKSTTAPGRRK